MAPLALGIDVGTTSTKAVVVRLPAPTSPAPEVAVLATASAPTPERADEIVATALRLAREVLTGAPGPPAAVGVASMAESGVPLDRRGDALTPVLRWDGARGGDQARRLGADVGFDAVFAATGVRLAAKTPLATWAWLGTARPDVVARTDRWAGAADLVVLALTGRLVTDHTLAGRTGAYRLEDDDGALPATFDAGLLAAVGWASARLPDVVRPWQEPLGVTSSSGVAAGIPRGTPVVVAGHDHAVGAWAAGVRHAGEVADSLGTAEAVLTVLPSPRVVDRRAVAAAGMSLVRTVSGDCFGLLAGTPDAGSLVRRWLHVLDEGADPARSVLEGWADPGGRPGGDLVLPYPSGRTCPRPDAATRWRFLARDGTGPDLPPPAPDVARWTFALLDGLALHARWMLAEQARLAASRPSTITVLGGAGAASSAWMWAKAAAAPAPHRVVTGEPVAAGAALLAAHRAHLLPADVPVLPGGRGLGAAPPAAGAAYDALFERFVAAALAGESSGGSVLADSGRAAFARRGPGP